MEERELVKLLKDMSLEEKADQLLQLSADFFSDGEMLTGPALDFGIEPSDIENAGSVLGVSGAEKIRDIQKNQMARQRHHIPMLFMADVINGFKTAFPIPLALGASFNPDIAYTGAKIAAKEASVSGLHVTFAPMADLARDARWGRVMESCGEDKYLNSVMTAAMVKGYQGEMTEDGKIANGHLASCVKHFAAYGACEGGRDYNNTEISERTLREDYLSAYEACIKAGASMVMAAFSTLNRIPASANPWLLRKVLRDEMKFDGAVISDWASIEELISHGVAQDKAAAALLAIKAGVDIDMATGCYAANLPALVKAGKVPEALLDEAVLRVLRLKNKLGLFENPYKDADEAAEKAVILCDAHRKVARAAAAECFVLLENDGILPLDGRDDGIVVAGPFADNGRLMGNWAVFAEEKDTVTVKTGVRKACPLAKVIGMPEWISDRLDAEDEEALEKWHRDMEEIKRTSEAVVAAAASAKTVVLTLGEAKDMSGEAHSRTDVSIPRWQMELFERVYAVNKNIIVLLFTGRPLCVKSIRDKARALMVVWHSGTEGGHAIADVLFGKEAPSGKLPMSFPYSTGQVPIYYSCFSTGRPQLAKYLDAPGYPLYPFGYGKTYTEFEYSAVQLTANVLHKGGKSIFAGVRVKNTGKRQGREVVQMYIRDVTASVIRPVRELKGFKKIELWPNEEKEVVFEITEAMLKFYTAEMIYDSEPGRFEVYIGGSSDAVNKADFVLEQDTCEGGCTYELS